MRLIYQTDVRSACPRPFRRGKRGTYWIRQWIAGRDVWRSTHTTDRREAEYFAVSIWRAQQSGVVKSIIPIPPLPVGLLWAKYEKSEKFELLAESTLHTRRLIWDKFVSFCAAKGIRTCGDVHKETVECFLTGDGSRKNHTWNNQLSELNAVFSETCPEENPCIEVKRKSIKKGEKASDPYAALSRSQIAAIYQATRHWHDENRREWLDAITVALNTGARYKDIAILKFGSVMEDKKGKFLCFAPEKTKNATGGKTVLVRMTKKLADLIARRREAVAGDFVFPALAADYHLPIDERRTTNEFNRMLRRKKVFGSFHCFRATVITAAARAGVDLKEFGGVVGHTTEAQTQAYNRAALDIDLGAVVNAI